MSPNGGRRGGSNRGSHGKRGKGKLNGKQIVLIVAAAFVVLCLIAQCSGGSQSPSSQPATTQSASETPTASGLLSAASAAPSESASDTQAAPSQTDTAQVGSTDGGNLAQTVLDELAVQDPASKAGYSRDQFGAAWSDVDHNGCDTRNDILKRDMTNVTFKANTYDCVVLTGTLNDPYTGKTIAFERGQNTSKAVQIDHVVALSNAWQTGAQNLSADQRLQLANDPYNLLAVDGPANQEKSDSDAASWLPSNTAFDCEYVARQIGVKHKYALWVTAGEKSAMQTVLATCPSQSVPTDGGVSDGAKAATQQLAAQNSAAQQSAAQDSARIPLRKVRQRRIRKRKSPDLAVPMVRMCITKTARRREPLAKRRCTRVSLVIVRVLTETKTAWHAKRANERQWHDARWGAGRAGTRYGGA